MELSRNPTQNSRSGGITAVAVVQSKTFYETRRTQIPNLTNRLLPGEGQVGRYGDLLKTGRRGDNLTPHHIPSHGFMIAKVPGYTRAVGIAIMMEHPVPGQGGRHRQTLSYGQPPALNLSPRQALAREVKDVRNIYRGQGLYTPQIRKSLQQLIKLNQISWSRIFNKGEK